MAACVAFGCTNRPSKKDPGISFHRFPNDPTLREAWVKAVNRNDWMPTRHSRLCSTHFSEDKIDRSLSSATLRQNAIPSIFGAYPSYMKKVAHLSKSDASYDKEDYPDCKRGFDFRQTSITLRWPEDMATPLHMDLAWLADDDFFESSDGQILSDPDSWEFSGTEYDKQKAPSAPVVTPPQTHQQPPPSVPATARAVPAAPEKESAPSRVDKVLVNAISRAEKDPRKKKYRHKDRRRRSRSSSVERSKRKSMSYSPERSYRGKLTRSPPRRRRDRRDDSRRHHRSSSNSSGSQRLPRRYTSSARQRRGSSARRRRSSSSERETKYRRRNISSDKDIQRRRRKSASLDRGSRRRLSISSERGASYRRRKSSSSSDRSVQRKRGPSPQEFVEKMPQPKNKVEKEQNFEESLREYENLKLCISTPSNNDTKLNIKEEEKSPTTERKPAFIPDYFCYDCQIQLNSEIAFTTHINGKKHRKKIAANELTRETALPIEVIPPPKLKILRKVVSDGMQLIPIGQESMVSEEISQIRGPVPGLDKVIEIRKLGEVRFHCEMCDALCVPITIINHLTGRPHRLKCLERIDEAFFQKIYYSKKTIYDKEISRILFKHEKRHGRGVIRVYKEVVVDPNRIDAMNVYAMPSTSYINDVKLEYNEMNVMANEDDIFNPDICDRSGTDFKCLVCDKRMNTEKMWRSHIYGKIHAKNMKKAPGEAKSKLKYYAVDKVSELEEELDGIIRQQEEERRVPEIYVGLGFITEKQNPSGYQYNCHLCGASCPKFDIEEHLLLLKHKQKYLEALNNEGKPNAINTIYSMSMQGNSYEALIDDECRRMVENYGPGKVKVYVSKEILQ